MCVGIYTSRQTQKKSFQLEVSVLIYISADYLGAKFKLMLTLGPSQTVVSSNGSIAHQEIPQRRANLCCAIEQHNVHFVTRGFVSGRAIGCVKAIDAHTCFMQQIRRKCVRPIDVRVLCLVSCGISLTHL